MDSQPIEAQRILVIDDDAELCALVAEYLAPLGFETEAAHDGLQGLERARSNDHSLILLDVMLPRLDGFGVLESLRKYSNVPVLMLTARGQDTDRIAGLDGGADDYLAKPFNPHVLAARIRSVLRRARPTPDLATSSQTLFSGGVELRVAERVVLRGPKTIELTNAEFALLERLMRSAGRVVSREILMRDVFERELDPFDRSLDVHVSHLRRKLAGDDPASSLIKTVRGEGYLFAARDETNPSAAHEAKP